MTSVMTDGPGESAHGPAGGGFEVHLDVFEGPFDLLLALICKHKLDITEIALSAVTDEFISYIGALADRWDLDQASYFLVVAATLLDLKAARLLPSGEVDDEEDLALLEARDLLFARLLQYRAYKEVAAIFAGADGRRRAAGSPGGCRWSPGSPTCCPRCCSGSRPSSSRRSRRPRSRRASRTGRLDRAPAHAADHGARAGRHHHGQAAAAGPGVVPRAVGRLRGYLRDRGALPRRARSVPGQVRLVRAGERRSAICTSAGSRRETDADDGAARCQHRARRTGRSWTTQPR